MSALNAVVARLAYLICCCLMLTPIVGIRAEGVLARIPTGNDPEAIAFNAATATLFVVNKGNDSVTVLDRVHNTSATVSVGHLPVAIALDPERNLAYVVNSGSNAVTRIDGATLATTPIAVGNAPDAIALDAKTNTIFVVNNLDATITRIDGATLNTTNAAVGVNPVAVAVDPMAQTVFVVNNGSNTATMLDETLSIVRTYPTGHLPTAIAIDVLHSLAYVINSGDTTLERISTSASLDSKGTVGLFGHPATISLAPSLGEFFVGFSDNDSVQTFDTLTAAFRLTQFGAPASILASDEVTGRLYVASTANQAISVLDQNGDSRLIVAGVNAPSALAVDALRHRVYCVENNAADLLEIGSTDYANTQPFGRIGLSFEVNPVANEIYATNYSSVVVIDGASLNVRPLPGVSAAYSSHPMAANSLLHKLYAPAGSHTMVADLDSGTTNTVATGIESIAATVNYANEKAYILDAQGQVFVLDSDENLLATVPVGKNPYAIVSDPTANRIFVSNENDSTVTVIDGRTNTASTVTVSGFPVNASPATMVVFPNSHLLYVGSTNGLYTIDTASLAVVNTGIECSNIMLAGNPLTEKLYCIEGNDVLVIRNGALLAKIPIDNYPQAIAVDPVLDKTYVAHYNSEDLEVIDGATDTYNFDYLGDILYALVVNPVTQQVFVGGNQFVFVVTPAPTAGNAFYALVTSITPLPHDVAVAPNAILTLNVNQPLSAVSGYQPQHVYYQVDGKTLGWLEASGGPGAGPYMASLSNLSYGPHVVFAYATDGTDATTQSGNVNTASPSAIAAYGFTVVPDVIFADGFE